MQQAEQGLPSLSVGLIMQQPNTQRTKDRWVFNGNCHFHTQTRLHNAPHGPPPLRHAEQITRVLHSLCMKYHQQLCPPLSFKGK